MRILLVEDDKALCKLLAFQLKKEGYSVDFCHNGLDAFDYLKLGVYQLMILDRMLPGMNGLKVLEKIRKEKNPIPVILLTALGEVADRVDGLDAGADDYLVKPFAEEELFARIRALIRRPKKMEAENKICCGDICLDLLKKKLTCKEKYVELSKKELDLLEYFIRNKGQTLTRNQLLCGVWGMESMVEDGNLDNYVYFLRRRLRQVGSEVKISTVRSVGYCLEG